VRLQLIREPRPYPELFLAHRDSIFDYTYDDVVVKNYDPHPAIKAPVAV
jgi:thymidylate synthase